MWTRYEVSSPRKRQWVVSRIWPGLVMCASSNAKVHGIPTMLSPIKPWKKCDQYLCFHCLSFVLLMFSNLITSNILPLPGLCLCFCFILQASLLYHWEDTIWLLLVHNAIIHICGNCRVRIGDTNHKSHPPGIQWARPHPHLLERLQLS